LKSVADWLEIPLDEFVPNPAPDDDDDDDDDESVPVPVVPAPPAVPPGPAAPGDVVDPVPEEVEEPLEDEPME
jgi:hypothetical protein